MSQTRFDGAFAPIAVATRSGLEESLHHGAAVVFDGGGVVQSLGDPDLVVYPRSSLKPLQADAMVALGLRLPPAHLAVACASHSGEPFHLDAVAAILTAHGLSVDDLANTPTRPSGEAAREAARSAGIGPSSLQQNCSGKHAAMLATCRLNDWPIADYLAVDHPLQSAITRHIDTLVAAPDGAQTAGATVHVGIDGCGAPTHAFSLSGLARAFSRIALAGGAVAHAMSARPDLVGGTGRDVTTWMSAVDGLVAKEGAAGVMAAATADGRSIAYKIADGSDAARQAVTMEAMRWLGVDDEVVAAVGTVVGVPVFGHGHPVGEIRALRWTR